MITENHFKGNSCIFNYKLYYPEQFKELPLLIYLHGAGERGDNIDHLDIHAIPRLIKNGIEYAYEHTDLVEWALAQRRTDFSYVPECLEELF